VWQRGIDDGRVHDDHELSAKHDRAAHGLLGGTTITLDMMEEEPEERSGSTRGHEHRRN
jgi:hypothetical protein